MATGSIQREGVVMTCSRPYTKNLDRFDGLNKFPVGPFSH